MRSVKKIRISAVCSLLLSGMVLQAQNQKGATARVVDAVSRQPLQGVSVRTGVQQNGESSTDEWGYFQWPQTPADSIYLSLPGYKPRAVAAGVQQEQVALEPDILRLQDVVVQAGGGSHPFTAISRVDLNLKPVRNTQELLRLVPGLLIAQHAGGGKAEQIFLRGFDLDHGTDIAISVDGMPVNMVSHAHGQGYADAHFIIPETIRQVDYGTGPYYAGQGNLNTAGYVSFSTHERLPHNRIELDGGRFRTGRLLAMLNLVPTGTTRQSGYVAGEAYYTNGPTINPQGLQRYNLMARYGLAAGPATTLTAILSAFSSSWDASGQIPGRAVAGGHISRFGAIDPSEGGNTSRYNASLQLAHRFAGGAVLSSQLYYTRYHFNLYSNFTFFLNDALNGDGIQQSEDRQIVGYNLLLNRLGQWGAARLQATYGAGVRADAVDNSRLAHVVQRRRLHDMTLGNIREWNAFAFARKQLSVGRWQLEGALRYDLLRFAYADLLQATQQPAQVKAVLSPKLNLQYTLNAATQLYLKGGKGFHANDSRVVVARNGRQILPAAWGADAGISWKPAPRLLVNLAAWWLYLDQEFVYVGDEGVVEPGGRTRRLGADLLARYQFNDHLFANLNLNLARPRALDVAKGADYIPLAPAVTSTGGLFYKRNKGWNGSLAYRYIRSRPANEDNSIVAKGYCLLDAALNYTGKHYEVGLAAENLLNSTWNEAQFATESRLRDEPAPVTELHFTPGTPLLVRLKLAVLF